MDKFNPISAWLYDSPDEETGSVHGPGWYGLCRWDADVARDARDTDGKLLPAADRAELARHVGGIVSEDDQGFVEYNLYTTEDELAAAWAGVEDWVAPYYEDEEA